ncbi:MAG: hypothetical protein LLG02_03075 [Pelosinus sp.]|nr:hypothetical protein [Pelosinus sp.]
MDKNKPIYITRNKPESTSFIKSKTGKVVGLFLAGTVAVSGYIYLQENEDKQDGQNANGSGGGGGGSGYHSYSSGSSAKSSSGEGISSGSTAKGGIGSSAVGGGE